MFIFQIVLLFWIAMHWFDHLWQHLKMSLLSTSQPFNYSKLTTARWQF